MGVSLKVFLTANSRERARSRAHVDKSSYYDCNFENSHRKATGFAFNSASKRLAMDRDFNSAFPRNAAPANPSAMRSG